MSASQRPGWLVPSLAIAALAVAAAHASAEAPPPQEAVAEETASDFGVIALGAGCRLENNVFNRKAIDDGRQRIYRFAVNGAPASGWEWNWTALHRTVLTFPSIVCGTKPWASAGANAAAGFPFRQGTKRLVVDWDAAVDASGTHALVLAAWAIAEPPGRPGVISHEIQIHLVPMANPPPGWLVEPLGAFAVDRIQWQLWRAPDGVAARQGALPDLGGHTWPVLIFVPRQAVTRGPLDVGRLLQRLVDRKLLPRGAWIADLELGSAVVEGRGRVQVTRFAIDLR
jgi:hypothetical protein